MREKIFFNQSQICTLEKLRDTLLPKLMGGEVRVAV
jgi:type I restriction enzyme S subunit